MGRTMERFFVPSASPLSLSLFPCVLPPLMALSDAVGGVAPLPAAAMQASIAASTRARALGPPLAPLARAGSVTSAMRSALAFASAEDDVGSRDARKEGRAAGGAVAPGRARPGVARSCRSGRCEVER